MLVFLQSYSQSIAFYADVMVNADDPAHRKYAAEEFNRMFAEELEAPSTFKNNFDELPWISIQYPMDSSFRTITWQVDHGAGKYTYSGYLQTRDNALHKMGGPRGRATHDNNAEINFDQWRGGLVYKVLSIPESSPNYFLLTFSILDQFTKAKTLEPLSFVDNQVRLGKEGLFNIPGDNRSLNARLAMRYSADTNASVTYEESSGRLVYDNLIVVQGRIPGQGPTYMPDGSYKAFEKDDSGKWVYVDKLYTQWNEGPLDAPGKKMLDNELFEKRKKN